MTGPSEQPSQAASPPGCLTPEGSRAPPHAGRFVRQPDGWLLCERADMSLGQRDAVLEFMAQSKSIFAYKLADLGCYNGELVGSVRIELRHDQAIYERPRQYSADEQEIMERKCTELREAGIIVPSNSTKYAMNSTMPAKRAADGTWSDRRFCQDARPLNAATKPDDHRPPLPEDLFQAIGGHRWLTKMDCRAAFNQLPLHPEDQEKTSFWWRRPHGAVELWKYTRALYGLRNISSQWQRVMDHHIRAAGLEHCVVCYCDDLLIHSASFEEHMQHLAAVFSMLRSIGLKLHPEKTLLCCDAVEFLGHMVSAEGLTPAEAKVLAFQAVRAPRSLKELQALLGGFNYYRCYIPDFSTIVEPLTRLTRKGVVWGPDTWAAEQQAALDHLKELFSQYPVLQRVQPGRHLILHTDFSGVGVAGVLGQLDEQGREHLCACVSRSLNVHERNYMPYKGELLAVVWAVKTLSPYLKGRPFTLVTDHAALLSLMQSRETLTGQFARWALILGEYDFAVVHRPGRLHQNADLLSRSPLPSTEDGSGARVDEDGDPLPPQPPLVAYPGSEWPAHASAVRAAGAWAPRPMPAAVVAALRSSHAPGPAQLAAVLADEPAADCLTAELCAAAVQHTALALAVASAPPACTPDADELLAGHAGVPADGAAPSDGPPPLDPLVRWGLRTVEDSRPALQRLPRSQPSGLRLSSDSETICGVDTRLVQHVALPAAFDGAGLGVLEFPGGLASGLQAALRAGLRVRRYVAFDPDPAATAVRSALLPQLALQYSTQFNGPGPPPTIAPPAASAADDLLSWLLDPSTFAALGLADGGVWLLVTSWASHALWREPSALRLVGGVQRRMRAAGQPPPAYLAEGTWRSAQDEEQLGHPWGPGAPLDAVQAGSPVHRVSLLYTNLACGPHVAACLAQLRPTRCLADVLPYGLQPGPATRALGPPYSALQAPGERWRALPPPIPPPAAPDPPPLQSAPDSSPVEPSPAVWAAVTQQPAQLLAAQPTAITLCRRHAPPAVLTACLAVSIALYRHFLTPHDMQPLPPRVLPSAEAPLEGEDSGQAGIILHARGTPSQPPAPPSDEALVTRLASALLGQRALSPGVTLQLLHMEAVASAADAAESLCPDVWEDAAVMTLLRLGQQPRDAAEQRRIQRRAAAYRWSGAQLLRAMPDGNTRVCPSPEAREDLARQVHTFAHLGVKRTLALLRLGYWWRGMRATVRAVVSACKLCDMANSGGVARPAQLQPLPIKGMFYRWGIDLAGPLPMTEPEGYTYVLVAIEHFSKWAELVPLRSKTAEETARALLQILTRFGSMAEVVTDRGAEWEGAFHQLLEQCFVDHRRTSAGHPQADGAAERMVQVVKAGLRKHCAESQRADTWDLQLPWLALAYRCSVQASTKYSPYHLVFGVEPIVPPAVRDRLTEPELQFVGEGAEEAYAEALAQRAAFLKQHAPAAAGNLLIAQHRDTRRYALTRSGAYQPRALAFAPGDYVYLRRKQAHSSLDMPVRDTVLRVERIGDLGVAVLMGRDAKRTRERVEQLVPCHLPDLDPIQDPRLQRPDADLPCER